MMRSPKVHRIVGLAAAVLLLVAATGCEPVPAWQQVKVPGFTPVSTKQVGSLTGDQGPATVHLLSGTTKLVYGGELIDKAFSADGWNHIGDPDSASAYIVYPYQAANPADGKMFNVITPHGRSFRYTHALEPGEAYNNSFAAISPDGKWLVSGEWGTQTRLLVFPMPMLNPSVPSGNRALPLAAEIELSTPLSSIQGCDFVSSTRLICAVDDAHKRLVNVRLPAALSGADVVGTVSPLADLPLVSTCTGDFEAEGLDYDPPSKLLRVQVIPPKPCFAFTDQYTYRKTP